MADTSSISPSSTPSASRGPGPQPKSSAPRIIVGDIDLVSFYHQGAIIRNTKGQHLLLVSAWAAHNGGAPSATVVRCDPKGTPLAKAQPLILSTPPATTLFERVIPRKPSDWSGSITLVKSVLEGLPSGITSDDPSLLLVPYGPHYGKPVGLLSEHERKVLHRLAKNPDFKKAIEGVKPLPGANQQRSPMGGQRLSDRGMSQLLKDQGELVRGIPMVTVIEQYCGYAPEEITGDLRKYRVGAEFINLNTRNNQFGSLNGFSFKSLRKERGSTNNAMDIVAAVKEMEGAAVDFKVIRAGLISHFNLQPQLDRMFQDALRREQEAAISGKPVEYAAVPKPDVEAALKQAAERKAEAEQEIEFNLATGLPVTATAAEIAQANRLGGGFAEREDIWPAARKYLVEERKLDPELIDYLYANRSLYAARRSFPAHPNFPYRPNFQDVIVAPVLGFKTGQVVGVDTKPLPTKPGEKTDGRNHGKTGQGAFMFGIWGPETKRVILTEGYIKGIAFLQLHRKSLRIGPETCLMSRSGAKPTLEIIPQLKQWGCEAIVAYDNDFTGRAKSKAFFDECIKQGVPCREMFVEPGEVTLSISQQSTHGFHDHARALALEQNIVSWATDNGVPWAFEREKLVDGYRSIRLPNTEAVIYEIEEILKDDRKLSGQEYQQRAKDVAPADQAKIEKRRWVKLELHHKDWDDIVKKGLFQPRVPEWRKRAAIVPTPTVAAPLEVTTAHAVPAPKEPTVSKGPVTPSATGASVKAVLVARGCESKGGIIYSVGTATQIFDLKLTDEQKRKAGGLLSEELPRDALVRITDTGPRVLEIVNIDGASVDVESTLGAVTVEPSPEKIQKLWQKPKTPAVISAVMQLRRESGMSLPTPGNSPTPEISQGP